jgi:hypothetical protein
LKSLKKEAIPPNALKFLPLSVKEIQKKRLLKTSEAIQLVLEVTREQAQVLGEVVTVEVSVG